MYAPETRKPNVWTTGFAIFSMFFGAGNIVFPLALGLFAKEHHLVAMFGFAITAILIPVIGLLTMVLYDGSYMKFFNRMGSKVGFSLILFILLIMGPLGALPRCVTTSYATVSISFPQLTLPVFSALSLLLVFFFTLKSRHVIKILGAILTPVLLVSLLFIIIKGLWFAKTPQPSDLAMWDLFLAGVFKGYNTMDLIASLFFASVVILALNKEKDQSLELHSKRDHKLVMGAALIGALLLALTYLGFTCLSAGYSELLAEVTQDRLLGAIAFHILGPVASIIVSVAVFFACLTTEIAIAVVFAEFLHLYLLKGKWEYKSCLAVTLLISFFVSTLRFEGISCFLNPVLCVVYPGLIMLTICNLCHKLFGFKHVRLPVAITFLIALLYCV